MAFLASLGRLLQVFGLATIGVVIILFFGQTEMKQLLYMTIVGILEFYAGVVLLSFIKK